MYVYIYVGDARTHESSAPSWVYYIYIYIYIYVYILYIYIYIYVGDARTRADARERRAELLVERDEQQAEEDRHGQRRERRRAVRVRLEPRQRLVWRASVRGVRPTVTRCRAASTKRVTTDVFGDVFGRWRGQRDGRAFISRPTATSFEVRSDGTHEHGSMCVVFSRSVVSLVSFVGVTPCLRKNPDITLTRYYSFRSGALSRLKRPNP